MSWCQTLISWSSLSSSLLQFSTKARLARHWQSRSHNAWLKLGSKGTRSHLQHSTGPTSTATWTSTCGRSLSLTRSPCPVSGTGCTAQDYQVWVIKWNNIFCLNDFVSLKYSLLWFECFKIRKQNIHQNTFLLFGQLDNGKCKAVIVIIPTKPNHVTLGGQTRCKEETPGNWGWDLCPLSSSFQGKHEKN